MVEMKEIKDIALYLQTKIAEFNNRMAESLKKDEFHDAKLCGVVVESTAKNIVTLMTKATEEII